MPDSLVVDASILVAVTLREERAAAIDVFDRGARLIAPEFVHVELASALAKAIWRGVFNPRSIHGAFAEVSDLFDEFVPSAKLAAVAAELAARLRCSAYDAAYLGLAMELDIKVATCDGRFAARAEAGGLANYVERFT